MFKDLEERRMKPKRPTVGELARRKPVYAAERQKGSESNRGTLYRRRRTCGVGAKPGGRVEDTKRKQIDLSIFNSSLPPTPPRASERQAALPGGRSASQRHLLTSLGRLCTAGGENSSQSTFLSPLRVRSLLSQCPELN